MTDLKNLPKIYYRRPFTVYGAGPNSPKIAGFIFLPTVSSTDAYKAILEAVLQDIPFNPGFINTVKLILK